MELSHVAVSVKNLDESLEFYQNYIRLPINGNSVERWVLS